MGGFTPQPSKPENLLPPIQDSKKWDSIESGSNKQSQLFGNGYGRRKDKMISPAQKKNDVEKVIS